MSKNPFYVQPFDINPALNAVGRGFAANDERKTKAAKLLEQNRLKKLSADAVQGGSDAMFQAMRDDPNTVPYMQEMGKFKNATTRQSLLNTAMGMLNNPQGAPQAIANHVNVIRQEGGDPTESESMISTAINDPTEAIKRALNAVMMFGDTQQVNYAKERYDREFGAPEYSNITTTANGQRVGINNKTGKLEIVPGSDQFQFNQDKSSVPPSVKTFQHYQKLLKEDPAAARQFGIANKLINEAGDLDVKTIRDINNDVTKLVKGTKEISNAATDIANLKASGSAAAQLATIFKFMKSLDPTSVVREGEQQMAVRTGGAADALVSYVQDLQGGGKLSSGVWQQMVDTAENLATSATTASNTELGNYLDVYGDKLSSELAQKIKKRVPNKYTLNRVIIPNHSVHGDITEADIRKTMKDGNITRAEVIDKLREY